MLSNNVPLHGYIQVVITLPCGFVTELGGPVLRAQKSWQHLEIRSIGSLCQEFKAIPFTFIEQLKSAK
jgi:hypothetical protein